MAIKAKTVVSPAEPTKRFRNQYTDSLENMFVEAIRVHQNFCTYQRWNSTDYTGPFSELKNGFLVYHDVPPWGPKPKPNPEPEPKPKPDDK